MQFMSEFLTMVYASVYTDVLKRQSIYGIYLPRYKSFIFL